MQEIKEEWRDIEGYSGLYQVSNLGRVKSLNYNRTGLEKILKPIKDGKKYLCVNLCKQGKQKHHKVHRLVGQAFIDNPNNYPQLNHIDEDKTNNQITNLEWCTAAYNNNYGTRTKRSAASRINHPKHSKQVLCVETSVVYLSTNEVERQLGFGHSHISSCCRGKRKTCGGFHWRYVE